MENSQICDRSGDGVTTSHDVVNALRVLFAADREVLADAMDEMPDVSSEIRRRIRAMFSLLTVKQPSSVQFWAEFWADMAVVAADSAARVKP